MALYLIRLSDDFADRAEKMETLTAQIKSFGELVSITEVGRRALTVDIPETEILPQLLDKVCDIAEIDEYQGLNTTPFRSQMKFRR